MLLTDSGVVLAICTHPAIDGDGAVAEIEGRGVRRYLAYPLELDEVRKLYPSVVADIESDPDGRPAVHVVDDDASRVFSRFSLRALRNPIRVNA